MCQASAVRAAGLALLCLSVPAAHAELRPVGLVCDGSTAPLGIDVEKPELGWRVESGERGQTQTAWEIRVASSPQLLAEDHPDLWDSGRVASDETQGIAYGGTELRSSQRVFWQVRVWDRAGMPSAWSPTAAWTMGLLAQADWRGVWIAAPGVTESLLLRREFLVRAGLRRAVVHVSGLGECELHCNGARVGNDFLSPGWTDYRKTALYTTADLTDRLHEGRNALGLLLGDGMYDVVRRDRFAKFTGFSGPLRAIVHLRLEYADGTVQFVTSDPSWRTLAGPIVGGGIYSGEDEDARLIPTGWDLPAFDDRRWLHAVEAIREKDRLMGHGASADPLREIEVNAPVSQRVFPDGSIVYDLGQNAAHIPRIRVSGPAGARVRLSPSEILHPDGTIDTATMGGSDARGRSWWQYTKATDGEETWQPHFSYAGCRYLKAECFPPDTDVPSIADGEPPPTVTASRLPKLDSVEGIVVHSIAAPVGQFSASNERLNRIRTLVRWAQRSNMVSVLTDCPHRERLGWLEQYHLNGPSLRYEFSVDRIFAKGMHDMADAQHSNGLMPEIAPEYTVFEPPFNSAAEWGAAFIIVPWQQREFTGGTGLLRRYYEPMKRYFAYLQSRTADDILPEGLGDWYDLGPKRPGFAQLTPAAITATAFFYEDASILSRTAGLLGHPDEAADFAIRAERIKASFNRHFFHPDTGSYGMGMAPLPATSQCANAMPLVMGMVPEGERGRVLAALVADVEKHGGSMTAGDVGFRYLLRALADGGRSDVIYRMIDQDEKPGYAYQLKLGATSLTEAWDANPHASHDHFMLGQVIEWFYHDLVGIGSDPAAPGFRRIVVNPQPVGDLAWAEATYDSIRGPIAVRWERKDGGLTLSATIPANTTATVCVPSRDGAGITEGGVPATASAGVSYLRRDGDRSVYSVGSGSYLFHSSW